jgi:hypothetical protein
MKVYGYNIAYRPVADFLVGTEPDTRPLDKLPWLGGGWFDTEAEREAKLAQTVTDLEAPRQGYRVERVERVTVCGRCKGKGEITLRPKGWRKKSAPPWYLCRHEECPECHGKPELAREVTDLFVATVEPVGAFGEVKGRYYEGGT